MSVAGVLSKHDKERPEVGDLWCFYTNRKTHEVREVDDAGMVLWCGEPVPAWGWFTDNFINKPDSVVTCLKCVSVKRRGLRRAR